MVSQKYKKKIGLNYLAANPEQVEHKCTFGQLGLMMLTHRSTHFFAEAAHIRSKGGVQWELARARIN